MPAPLVIGALAAIGASITALLATAGPSIAKAFVKRQLNRHRDKIEQWAMREAWEAVGLEGMEDGNITAESFTQAINQHLLADSGVQLSNVFNRDAVRADLERYVFQRAAGQLGLNLERPTLEGLREAVHGWITDRVIQEINSNASVTLIADAQELARVMQAIERIRQVAKRQGREAAPLAAPVPKKPLLMHPEAIANRERQRRYRATHSRRWVPNGYGAESTYEPIAGE